MSHLKPQVYEWPYWVLNALIVTAVSLLCATLVPFCSLAQPSYLNRLHSPAMMEV